MNIGARLVTTCLRNKSCSQELHYIFYSTHEKASQHKYKSQMESQILERLAKESNFMI
jgi:hypothetical protein